MVHGEQHKMTILDPQNFAANKLASSDGLNVAIGILESCLAGPDVHLGLIVQDLCSVPNLFEFIFSVLPSAEGLVCRILDAYPLDPALFETSFTRTLVQMLSSTIFALPPHLSPTDTIRHIGRNKIYVEDALPVLKLLTSANFSELLTAGMAPPSTLEDPEYNDEDFSGFSARNKKQKKSRRKNTKNPTIDAAPFHKLGIKVPLNNAEARQTAREIARDLKMILKFYLDLLLEPSFVQPLRDAYIATDTSRPTPSSPQESKRTEPVEQKPPAYPKVQPVKAALYFENADGFGEWRIIIGTDATRELRELAHSDRKKCGVVVKKIKQLSNGHFSDENQKRLNGNSGVPIFEAKMQRDLRLVYQIDVVPDHDGEFERQVIKIYGIYTHTQLNRIWDAVGQHLIGKGKEYRRRCIFRNRPVHTGSDIYLPASFPPECITIDTKPRPLGLSGEDMGKLHSLLVLEKYVAFSQAFLHSLIVNQDVQHVFELTQQERKIIDCTTSCYVLGRSGTGKTTTMLFKMLGIQRAWEMQKSNMPKPRQIFVTKSRVLASKVEEYFVKLLESLALAGYSLEELKRMQARSTEIGLVDADDEDRIDVPQKYSALQETHFPLFVTFDKLAKMIAADVLSGDHPDMQRVAKFFINTDEIGARDSLVTYDIFDRTYWPHFPQPLTKGIEPWLVFSEFMGIIKGSEKSLQCLDGYLDRETYCSLPTRSNPTFANQRETLYALFEAYCKLKKERRHHDVADRTHAILKALMAGTPLGGQKVDYLYIDEAQDNLLIDAFLLRYICRNPEGLFWAGDTAQTISAGSSFRFDDLKAFLYRIEQDHMKHLIQDRSVNEPKAFQLAINYRSHGGIVSCAHTVIERITQFWPDAIDGLQQEHGIVDGFKPVFFRGWDQDTVRYEQFLFGESGSRIEFGAQQCILVRDKAALEKLRKEVGEIGLIMTLYDSKGLEFNDVLLYNFFEDSAVDATRWRVLLNHAEGEIDGQDLSKIHAPSFERDEGRFAGVCSELKLLYVGITRARKNLWIFDTSDKSEYMRMIWTSRNQVENCTPGTDVPHLAVSSTSAEWESFGYDLFKHKRYPQAMHCFDRASLPRMVVICNAYHLREIARAKIGVAPPKVQQDSFLQAADAFMESGDDAPAGRDRLQYYRNAAECFVRAGEDRKAALGYLSARDYDKAARYFRKAGLFDETLEVLHEHSAEIPSESLEELYTICRLYYCSKHDCIRPRFPLFPTYEEELEFLQEYDLDFARVALLEVHGRYMEAAELHLSENRPLDAIKDFLKEKGSPYAIQKATDILLDGLWRRCSFAVPSQQVMVNQDVSGLLKLALELPSESLDPLVHNEISMFRAIARADLVDLEKLSRVFLKEQRNAAALLSLDHFFARLPESKSFKLQDMSIFLEQFRNYTRLLYQVVSHPDPLRSMPIKRLFCIREISDIEYGIEPGSFLHSSATGDRYGPIYLHPSAVLSKQQIILALRKYLSAHLRERVIAENELCYEAVVFSPCLTYIVTQQCNRVNCPLDHVNRADLDAKYYNTRVGVHLQQMCILQYMYSAHPALSKCREERQCILDWLVHLYESLNPESHVQGSIADLDVSLIPGANEGRSVMKHWVWETLHFLTVSYDPKHFLTTVLKLTSLLFTFYKSDALKCINQAPLVTHDYRAGELVYPDGTYAFEDIVSLFHGTKQTSISSGLKFLRHVLKLPLPLNLSVLCDCLEEVISKISISWRLSPTRDSPLDGLVLPRGWLSNKEFSRQYVHITLLLELLDRVQDLLMSLQSGSAGEIYVLSHTKLMPIMCNIFTSRICRSLCFLAHNTRDRAIVFHVEKIFQALQTVAPVQRTRFLYLRYTWAKPHEYLKTMVTYDEGVVIQDLVQLLHKRRKSERPLRLPRITNIEFRDQSEIPSLVNPRLVAARSDLRAEAPVFLPHGVQLSQPEAVEGPKVEEPMLGEPEVEPAEEVYDEQPEDLPPVTNEPALVRAHEHTEKELWAAVTIQTAYRTYRGHCEAQARAVGKGLKAKINTVFILCLRNVFAFDWQRHTYRTLYLWALPSLVVCVDQAIAAAKEFKRKTRTLLLKESHERLEEVMKRTSEINALLKEGHALRKRIDPDADMHQRKDKGTMKAAVSDVKVFIHQLPVEVQDIRGDFDVAYRLVMAEKESGSKQKPELNTEDLYLYE